MLTKIEIAVTAGLSSAFAMALMEFVDSESVIRLVMSWHY